MKLQKQIIVLVALLVLAVAACVTSAEEPDPVGNFIRETCKSVVEQAKPQVIEMCKQAIRERAVEAVCNLVKTCTTQGLLAALLKGGGLFG